MIRLKKAAAAKKAEEEASAQNGSTPMEEAKGVEASSTAESKSETGTGRSVKLLGIGGKATRTEGTTKATKKRTPGEIRIQKDIAELDGGTVATVSFPNANDLTTFHVSVTPESGYWNRATYHFTFSIPAIYPHEPPKVHCDTKIFHPNIDLQGNVCLNILREEWKPVLDINAVIYGLIYLFYEPNPHDPLNHEAADLYRNNIMQFERIVQRTLQGQSYNGEIFQRLL